MQLSTFEWLYLLFEGSSEKNAKIVWSLQTTMDNGNEEALLLSEHFIWEKRNLSDEEKTLECLRGRGRDRNNNYSSWENGWLGRKNVLSSEKNNKLKNKNELNDSETMIVQTKEVGEKEKNFLEESSKQRGIKVELSKKFLFIFF